MDAEAVRDGLPSRAGDRHGPAGLRSGDPRAAQRQRGVRGGADAGGVALQPRVVGRAGQPERAVRRGHVHCGERVPRALRLRERPGGVRVRHGRPGVLWAGPAQRAGPVHSSVQRVRRPWKVRVLGRVPPHGARQPRHRQPVHDGLARLRQPHEPQHRPRDGCQAQGARGRTTRLAS
jgi:hypothetical protein